MPYEENGRLWVEFYYYIPKKNDTIVGTISDTNSLTGSFINDQSGVDAQVALTNGNYVISSSQWGTINEGMAILRDPLERALDYEDLFEIARRDTLTGLANRRVFEERIGPLMDASRRHKHPLTIACMDLDHFKQINDTLGHDEGDRVLQKVANTFQAMVRSSDLLVRMGGDEFLIVLPETDMAAALKLSERLCQAIAGLGIYSAPGEQLGVSIGLSQWHPGITKDEWLRQTDELLYQAKDNGRCQVCS